MTVMVSAPHRAEELTVLWKQHICFTYLLLEDTNVPAIISPSRMSALAATCRTVPEIQWLKREKIYYHQSCITPGTHRLHKIIPFAASTATLPSHWTTVVSSATSWSTEKMIYSNCNNRLELDKTLETFAQLTSLTFLVAASFTLSGLEAPKRMALLDSSSVIRILCCKSKGLILDLLMMLKC